MKSIFAALLVAVIVGTASIASAVNYSFSFFGSDKGGVGSAWMDIGLAGNQLNMTLKNTSPVPVNQNYYNPAITGFGFNLIVENVAWSSWELKAFDRVTNSLVTIGKNNLSSYLWTVGTTDAGVTLDYLPNISGMEGALYNPDATDRFGAAPQYFTNAFLTMTFNTTSPLTLANEEYKNNSDETATYVRMQSVGERGSGSLKLFGEERIPPSSVPEPGTMILVGAGLAGIALLRRAKRK